MSALYLPFQPLLTDAGLQRFDLSMQQQLPRHASLKGIVHSYLQVSTTHATPYPMMPDGTQAIFISPEGSLIGGAQSQSIDFHIAQAGEYFGIRFYPAALRHFFKLNLSEISGQFVDCSYFPSKSFAQLHHAIYQVKNFTERAEICEQQLLQLSNPMPADKLDHALHLIYQSFGNIKISQLATSIGLSSRHLNRLFQQHIGLNTKTFTQTIRLQQTCQQLFIKPYDSLQTASELGYFDQAHLLNDYKKRLSLNPHSLFNRFMSDFYNS